MRKLIAGLMIAMMVAVPFTSAVAETTSTTTPASVAIKQDPTKKAARDAFKAGVATKKAELKAQYERNQALRTQIKTKHTSIRATLKDLRKENTDASKAKIAEVKKILVSLSTNRDALKALRNAGKPYWEQFKTNAKATNLDAALVNLNSIAGVKDARYEQLTKINTTLDSVLALLAK